MNILLTFFALPVATVILAIVLQKILNNPLLVAATFFAIYLIVTFAAFDASFLVFAILYTLLAYVAAVLTRAICHLTRILDNNYRITQRPVLVSYPNATNNAVNLASQTDANMTNINNGNTVEANTQSQCCCRRNRR